MAKFIEWDESISVGIQELDEQHKQLIVLINSLYDAMVQGQDRLQVAREVMDELVQYTVVHFTVEESLFRIFDYPEYEAHCAHHKELRDQVSEINLKVQSGERQVTPELLFFLKKWLTGHIMGEDRKYAPFLVKQGVKSTWRNNSWIGRIWRGGKG